ncbi:MAG: hypothetical protein R2822_01285 [Spirosomataceae bacterium]
MRQFNTFPLAIYPNIYADFGYVRNQYTEFNNSRLANRSLYGAGVGLDVMWYNFCETHQLCCQSSWRSQTLLFDW